MTVLSDKSIVKLIADKQIVIEPFKEDNLTPNGYDLTVSEIEIPDEKKSPKVLFVYLLTIDLRFQQRKLFLVEKIIVGNYG